MSMILSVPRTSYFEKEYYDDGNASDLYDREVDPIQKEESTPTEEKKMVIRVLKTKDQQKKDLINVRNNWKVGDPVKYFFKKERRWVIANIIEIYFQANPYVDSDDDEDDEDDRIEYLRLSFKNEYNEKEEAKVKRYDYDLKPLKLVEPRKSVRLNLKQSRLFVQKLKQEEDNIYHWFRPINLSSKRDVRLFFDFNVHFNLLKYINAQPPKFHQELFNMYNNPHLQPILSHAFSNLIYLDSIEQVLVWKRMIKLWIQHQWVDDPNPKTKKIKTKKTHTANQLSPHDKPAPWEPARLPADRQIELHNENKRELEEEEEEQAQAQPQAKANKKNINFHRPSPSMLNMFESSQQAKEKFKELRRARLEKMKASRHQSRLRYEEEDEEDKEEPGGEDKVKRPFVIRLTKLDFAQKKEEVLSHDEIFEKKLECRNFDLEVLKKNKEAVKKPKQLFVDKIDGTEHLRSLSHRNLFRDLRRYYEDVLDSDED